MGTVASGPGASFWASVPGSFGPPLLGQSLAFYRDYLGLVRRFHDAHGATFRMRLLGQETLVLLGADANRFVLADHADAFSSCGGWEFSLAELFPRGLMLRDGEDHRYHRRILQVAFQRPALVSYLDHMDAFLARHFAGAPVSTLRVYQAMKGLTLDLAARVFLGLELEDQIAGINRAFQRLVKGATAFVRVPVPGLDYARGLRARRQLEAFFREAVRRRRAEPTEDVLGRLCTAVSEEGERLSDQEVVDHIIFFMMAAHDTTTSALTSLFYELTLHPEWQERLRAESRRVAAGGALSLDRLRELEGLGWAIRETLRLHPPLVVIPRRTVEALEFRGYRIPAGTNVSVTPAYTHRMPAYWTDPERFDPERFSEPRGEDRKVPFSYVPFGGGAHLCLGMFFADMQARLTAHHYLLRYRWRTRPGYRAPYKQVPIQAPRDGLPVRIETA
jgi:cytochrome P450